MFGIYLCHILIKVKYLAIYPSEGCFSDASGPFRTNNPPKYPQTYFVRELFTLLGHFSKNHILPTSYILVQKKTQNPNIIFKISIYHTNSPNTPKYFRTFRCFLLCFQKFPKKTTNNEKRFSTR